MTEIDRYLAWLAIYAPTAHETLRPGASAAALRKLEAAVRRKLPAAVKGWLGRVDGQESEPELGALYGAEMLSCRDIISEWAAWEAVRRQDEALRLNSVQAVRGPGTIQAKYAAAGWIPLFRCPGRSDYFGVDLDPGPKGTIGQIINFGRDEPLKYVAAPDLAGLFAIVNGWATVESRSRDAAAARAHIEALFARGGLLFERLHALGTGKKVRLTKVPARATAAPKAILPVAPPGVEKEHRELMAAIAAYLHGLGARARQARYHVHRRGGTTTGEFEISAGRSSEWVSAGAWAIHQARDAYFDALRRHKLPERLELDFERTGKTWISTLPTSR